MNGATEEVGSSFDDVFTDSNAILAHVVEMATSSLIFDVYRSGKQMRAMSFHVLHDVTTQTRMVALGVTQTSREWPEKTVAVSFHVNRDKAKRCELIVDLPVPCVDVTGGNV